MFLALKTAISKMPSTNYFKKVLYSLHLGAKLVEDDLLLADIYNI